MSIRTEPEPQPVVEVPPVPVRRGIIQRAADRFPAIESFAYSDFRWLWASALTSYLGMNMQWITRSWLVLKLADDSPLALASVIVTFALPMTLISPIGGALADRISRKRIMLYTQLGNAVLTLGVGLLDFAGVIELWHIIVSGLINGSLMAFNMPSRQATVSDIIPQSKLMNGMSLMSSSMNATRILGPALAGVLIIFVGTSGVFFLISGVYALTVLTMLPIRVGREGQKRSGKSMYGDIIAGLSYARSSSPLLGLIIMAFIPILFGMSLYALLPAWARETLDVQSDNLGALYAAMGIGALMGSLGLASIPRFNRRGLLLLSSCVVWGIVLAVVAKMGSYNGGDATPAVPGARKLDVHVSQHDARPNVHQPRNARQDDEHRDDDVRGDAVKRLAVGSSGGAHRHCERAVCKRHHARGVHRRVRDSLPGVPEDQVGSGLPHGIGALRTADRLSPRVDAVT